MDSKLKEEWERLKKVLSSKNWDAEQEATFFGFFCHGWYGRLNEAAYQAENLQTGTNIGDSERFLEYEEWYAIFEDSIHTELAETGADREMDFDSEREFEKRYEMYLNAQ